jgi:hypothetical protein
MVLSRIVKLSNISDDHKKSLLLGLLLQNSEESIFLYQVIAF